MHESQASNERKRVVSQATIRGMLHIEHDDGVKSPSLLQSSSPPLSAHAQDAPVANRHQHLFSPALAALNLRAANGTPPRQLAPPS